MFLVVCYDVVCDKRRGKLHRALRGFLAPVQKSVFEGRLAGRRYPELVRAIGKQIDRHEDHVRIYHLCAGCRPLCEQIGAAIPLIGDPDDAIV